MRGFCRISDQWIHELFQNETLVEIELSDTDHANLDLAISLSRVLHVQQAA